MASEFLDNFKCMLERGQLVEALKDLKKTENAHLMDECMWDLVATICEHLKKHEDKPSDHCDEDEPTSVVDFYEDMLKAIGDACKAKEVLLAFLEQADSCKDDVCFRTLLRPIQRVLLSVPGKRGKSLEWALATLSSHICSLPQPKDHQFEGKELMFLDLDPEVSRVVSMLGCYISFFEPFVKEISVDVFKKSKHERDAGVDERLSRQREILIQFLMPILEHPLGYLDLTSAEGKPKSSSRVCAERVMNCICQLQWDLFKVYEEAQTKRTDVEECSSEARVEISDLSLGILGYLHFVEGLELDRFPCVYSHFFIFELHLPLVTKLLSKGHSLFIFKGLSLARQLLSILPDENLPCDILDSGHPTSFCKMLTTVMIHCPVRQYRLDGLKLLELLLKKMDNAGKYKIMSFLLHTETHAGVKGLIISHFKNNVHRTLMSNNVDPNPFLGANLRRILHLVAHLRDGVETDIVEDCDHIMAALNLIRYLCLRDKEEQNVTGIWDHKERIRCDFLEPLRKAIDLSRAHYKLRTKELAEAAKPKGKGLLNATVSVGDQTLPNLPPDHQEQIIKSALQIFDMIESVLVRVEEVMNP